jgi:hypothetical protein
MLPVAAIEVSPRHGNNNEYPADFLAIVAAVMCAEAAITKLEFIAGGSVTPQIGQHPFIAVRY